MNELSRYTLVFQIDILLAIMAICLTVLAVLCRHKGVRPILLGGVMVVWVLVACLSGMGSLAIAIRLAQLATTSGK
jgi:hypothetical protein